MELNLSLMTILLYYFLVLNFFTFFQIAFDKWQAKKGKKRIPERTLLSFTFFGGTIGSGLAMLIFRHKTAKTNYLWKFWTIVFIQIAIIYLSFHFEILDYKI